MKLLQINSVCGIRSTGRICTDIAEILRQEGHECKIAYGRESAPEKHRSIAHRIGSDLDVKLHALRTRLFDSMGLGSSRATKRLIKWIEEYDPDVIHLHNLHGYYINIKILFEYLARANKPVVWTLHDCWSFTGHCVHFERIGCRKWSEGGCHACPAKSNYPSALLRDASARNFKLKKRLFTAVKDLTVVVPSEWLAALVRQSYLGGCKVRVIPNGIDLSVFQPTPGDFRERHGLGDKRILLGVASAWGHGKGLGDFIKLSSMLDDSYQIVLVGLTAEQKAALPPAILGIERTNSTRELAEIYTAADLCLNLTYADTYPTVNLEAQACGTPVITYRTGGSPESVSPEAVVEQGDLEGLCHKIKSFEQKQIADTERFDKIQRFKEYIELYKSLEERK